MQEALAGEEGKQLTKEQLLMTITPEFRQESLRPAPKLPMLMPLQCDQGGVYHGGWDSPVSPSSSSDFSGSNKGPKRQPLRLRRVNLRNAVLQISMDKIHAGKRYGLDNCAVRVGSKTKQSVTKTSEFFTERYELFEVIGEGSLGSVRRGRRKADDVEVAVKIVRNSDPQVMLHCRQEFEVLRSIDHPSIVKALDFFVTAGRGILVMEHFTGLSLDKAIRAAPRHLFSEEIARRLIRQILQAIGALHKQCILHRDIKPDNILVSEDLQVIKMIDFNTAWRQILEGDELATVGTVEFHAPEVLNGGQATEVSEVFAAGLCLHFMLTGKLPTRNSQNNDLEVDFNDACWNGRSAACKGFLLRCLDGDAGARHSVDSALAAEWLSSVSAAP